MYVRVMLGLIGVLTLIVAIELKYRRRPTAAPPPPVVEEIASDSALDRRLVEVSFDQVPLERALTMLGAQAHANIVARDWKEIANSANPTITAHSPVTLKVHDVSLRAAIQAVFKSVRPDECVFNVLDGDVIEIHSTTWGREQPRVYYVRDLVPRPTSSLIVIPIISDSDKMFGVHPSGLHDSVDRRNSLLATYPADDELHLYAVLQDMLDSGFDESGAPTAFLIPGLLVTNASPVTDRILRQLLAETRHPISRQKPAPTGNTATDALRQRIPELNMDNVALGTAIDRLRVEFHANIIVRWSELEVFDISTQTPVTIHRRDVSLAEALTEILEPLPKDYKNIINATFSEDDDFITIGLGQHVSESGTAHVYDVSDLLKPDAPWARRLRRPGATPIHSNGNLAAELIKIIQAGVDVPDAGSFGRAGIYRYWNGRLFVRHLSPAHLKIEAILRKLRE